ncbi:MAG: hypothetical protein GKR88_04910 [Flavobacteriaceae bacterium]|nr:MAG: hypothetical protein GKR88_04910 [Flavobacteriaceae bacterium]
MFRIRFLSGIYILVASLLIQGSFAQKLTFTISAEDAIEHAFLQKIAYDTIHKDKHSLNLEVEKIGRFLKRKGYFLYETSFMEEPAGKYTVVFKLGFRVTNVHIYIPKQVHHPKRGDTLVLKTAEVEPFLEALTRSKDREGKSFAEVSLEKFRLKDTILSATLKVKEKKSRRVDAFIVKGYEAISKKIIRHDLNINKGALFNKEKLKEISGLTKALPFVSEIKPPEVLFTKDSTVLYIYLKKKNNNSIDGIASFASNENSGELLFNGMLDLKLNNILNGGEHLSILWNSVGNERQAFFFKTNIPYIFDSKLSPELQFDLYKQDSTFLNTSFHAKLSYKINNISGISFNYSDRTSNNLKEDITNNAVEAFDNSLYGVGYHYKNATFKYTQTAMTTLYVEVLFGTRNSVVLPTEKQTKFHMEFSKLFVLNSRNQYYLKNETGVLISDSFLNNEVYRIGGANSIRGFNEQSIFTPQYSFFNLEYRYLTSATSYLYSISDIGVAKKINNTYETLLGLGIGYLTTLNTSQINLGYVLGKSSSSTFDFSNSKLMVSWKAFF